MRTSNNLHLRFRGASGQRTGILGYRAILPLAFILLCGWGAIFEGYAFASSLDIPAWKKALRPLETAPVQDSGYIRSMMAFGQSHLAAISGESSWNDMPALLATVYFMAEPEAAASEPLLKITRPEIGQALKAKRISLAAYRNPQSREALMRLFHRDSRGEIHDETGLMPALNEMEHKAQLLERLEDDFAIVPRKGEWISPKLVGASNAEADRKIASAWEELKAALRANDAQAGEKAAETLRAKIFESPFVQGAPLDKLSLDSLYLRIQPFGKAALLYLLAALCYGGGLLFGRKRLFVFGYGFLALGLLAHALGIVARWIISSRPPLSNMYESFIFAIGGMVLVALIFEVTHRLRLAGFGASLLGFIFMVLAFKAPIFDSKISPLMPALQSSWLTYHVVTIMLSYSAFALSFFVSLVYLAKDFLGGDQSKNSLLRRLPSLEALDIFNYKIIAVGFPLLTIGIILGAVWAATAWGRPWGFDPKETWSAITWLIYTVYLHARYIGGWKGRRAAFLAILGFAGVLFTYFGVNYLLPGLHSYA